MVLMYLVPGTFRVKIQQTAMYIQNFSTREKEKNVAFSNLTLFFTDKALATDIIPGSLDFPYRFRGCSLLPAVP